MSGEAIDFDDAKSGKDGDADQKRERSSIAFPYNDVEGAIEVARAIHGNAGLSCDMDQLAGYMGQSLTSGAFRLQVSSARIFGLIETGKGKVTLTELGQQIVDPAQERKAKADAFLKVPLYKAVYDKYRGATIPPPKALERDMVALGVSGKQADRARQAFERSAEKSGYFEQGKNRLVMPAVRDIPPPVDTDKSKRTTSSGGGGSHHPFIEGLLQKLPEADSEWSLVDRARWLQAAAHIFGLMYTSSETGEAQIKVSVESPMRVA